MKKHVKLYYDYFDLGEQDFVYCEYSYIVLGAMIKADNIHHVEHGKNKHDHINNLMALSYDNHTKAHNEQLNRYYLKEIHIEFLQTNPY